MKLNAGYAVSFNHCHRRHGQLFQNRYKSFLDYKTDPADLKTASKEATISQARSVLCYLAVRKLKISCAEVARTLGISPATVSRASARATEIENLKQLQNHLLRDI